ncbi:CBS domain-containing protein [Calderihabitans maritimus]|uniref:Signal transduction protein n=1 Tax=Calderihabitans maritimus TaxID=1246530 RepID=A0A1Z5HPU1_9FIRM|nr:CBS domain-containing protein [Calderihabitans maritimus]GAW91458.1 signal transduction protein [Calderihabitans maritimus]
MFVRDHMTVNPITVPKDLSVLDALELMKRHNIRRLPVTEKEQTSWTSYRT